MRILLVTVLLFALAPLPAGGAEERDQIWSALVLATNAESPAPVPKALEPYASMLQRIFGYSQFEIVGQHSQTIDSEQEKWLLPSKHLFLRVDSQRSRKGEHRLNLALFQDQRLLVETKADLGERSPLFIRGPLYGQGQLIIVLVVR